MTGAAWNALTRVERVRALGLIDGANVAHATLPFDLLPYVIRRYITYFLPESMDPGVR